jgi:hypothetical protein
VRSLVVFSISCIGLALLVIGGAGPILAAICPTDPLTTPMDAMTIPGTLHSLGALLGDALLIAATLLTIGLLRNNPRWRVARGLLIMGTIVAWIAFALVTTQMMVLLPQHGGQLGPEVQIGWSSRFWVVVSAIWVMMAAWGAGKVHEVE